MKKKTDLNGNEGYNQGTEHDEELINPAQNTEETADNQATTVNTEELYRKEAEEWRDKYTRLYAEFDNFRKRTSRERLELLKTAGKEIVTALLPVLDDFDRAVQSMDEAKDIKAVKEGITLIHSKCRTILNQQGLRDMESKGQTFDPDLHEAITNMPAPDEKMKGKVIDELEKGYYLHDKVIRFAKVIVGT